MSDAQDNGRIEEIERLVRELEGQRATVRVHEFTIRQVSTERDTSRAEVTHLQGALEAIKRRFTGDFDPKAQAAYQIAANALAAVSCSPVDPSRPKEPETFAQLGAQVFNTNVTEAVGLAAPDAGARSTGRPPVELGGSNPPGHTTPRAPIGEARARDCDPDVCDTHASATAVKSLPVSDDRRNASRAGRGTEEPAFLMVTPPVPSSRRPALALAREALSRTAFMYDKDRDFAIVYVVAAIEADRRSR